MSDAGILYWRRFDDLSSDPKLYRVRDTPEARALAGNLGYCPAWPPVEQNPPLEVCRPRGCGGRVAPRTRPLILGEE